MAEGCLQSHSKAHVVVRQYTTETEATDMLCFQLSLWWNCCACSQHRDGAGDMSVISWDRSKSTAIALAQHQRACKLVLNN